MAVAILWTLAAACVPAPVAPDATDPIDVLDATSADIVSRCSIPRADAALPALNWDAPPDALLPNLVPVVDGLQVQARVFGAGSCEVMEGCTLPGARRLLRFDLSTPNLGRADLYLGSPTDTNRPDGAFEFGRCHNHWHLRGYADYRLLDPMGAEVGRGHKQSFCLEDTFRWMNQGRSLCPGEQFGCENQGIHAGYFDLYPRSLDCQYVDVTDLPPGNYRLRVRINVERALAESSYDDNEALVDVTIAATIADAGSATNPTDACAGDVSGPDRECGWVAESSRECVWGTTVTLGCTADCAPSVGVCAGNPMIRVCQGSGPCTHGDSIAENDDACGGVCSSVTFRCPVGGMYSVMTGAHQSGAAYECRLEAR